MHHRPDSLRPRRCVGTPFTIAASLALTVGLLGSATAAHAAEAPPTSPTPTASATTNAPALKAAARGELVLKPGEKPKVGTEVKWTVTVTNTGDVPLDEVADNLVQPGLHLEPGQTRELTWSTPLVGRELKAGFAYFAEFVAGLSPDGTVARTRVDSRLALPSPTPTPTPTTPAPTPTTPAPSPAPTAAEHPALESAVRGELVLKPGEKPKVGTKVKWTITVTNTGDVPLDDVAYVHTSDRLDLQPGQTSELTVFSDLDQAELSNGYAEVYFAISGTTPGGTKVTADLIGRLALSTPAPTPTPTPTTPAPTPTTPAPSPAPTTAEDPSLRARGHGELVLQPGETPKVGTSVRWIVTVTNTGDVRLLDIAAEGSEDRIALDPGQTGELRQTTALTQEDLSNGYTVLDTVITGRTPAGTEAVTLVSSKVTFAAPTPPTPTPTPPAPTPTPTPPAPTPAPVPVTPTPTPSSSTSAAVLPVTPGSTGSTGSTAKVSSATETAQRRLASTGYDATGALPAAGILTALGALGVLLGRRRRRHRTAD